MEKKVRRRILITLFFVIVVSFPIPFIIYNIRNRNPDLYSICIKGNVSEEITYTYEDIVDGLFGIVENQQFTSLNSVHEQYDAIYTGVSVWVLLTQTLIMFPNSTSIYFQSYDSYTTEEISLEKVEQNPNGVIIAYQKGNDPLNPKGEGPMRAIVSLNVTNPDYNSKYWTKQVNTIFVV